MKITTETCLCGLSQGQLDRHLLVGKGGLCTALKIDGSNSVCNVSLGKHPLNLQRAGQHHNCYLLNILNVILIEHIIYIFI